MLRELVLQELIILMKKTLRVVGGKINEELLTGSKEPENRCRWIKRGGLFVLIIDERKGEGKGMVAWLAAQSIYGWEGKGDIFVWSLHLPKTREGSHCLLAITGYPIALRASLLDPPNLRLPLFLLR
jgi:hypothetical protein